jgi:hypothetical protein
MKRLFSIIVLTATVFVGAQAQTSLVGRVYYHPNIMADEMKAHEKKVQAKLDEAIREEIEKAEKKKGRPLTAEEKAQTKKEAEEASKRAILVMKSTKTSVTATFKSDKEMEMQMKFQMDDDALKNAGVSWAKRKAIKAAIALLPSKEKMQYTVQGNLIICSDGTDKDTLTLSDDGKYLYGKMDDKTKFKLTRKQ